MKRIFLSAVALPLTLSAGAAIAAEEGAPTLRALGDLPAGLTSMTRGELASIEGGLTITITLPVTTQVANQVATAVGINVAALTTDIIQATDIAISQATDQVAP